MSSETKKKVKVALYEEMLAEKKRRLKMLEENKLETRGIVKGLKTCADMISEYQAKLQHKIKKQGFEKIITKKGEEYICKVLEQTDSNLHIGHSKDGKTIEEFDIPLRSVKERTPMVAENEQIPDAFLAQRIEAGNDMHKTFSNMTFLNTNDILKIEGKLDEVQNEIKNLENAIEFEKNKETTAEAPTSLKDERKTENKKVDTTSTDNEPEPKKKPDKKPGLKKG